MAMPAKAASGTTIAASSHGPASGLHATVTDPMVALGTARAKLESASDFWYSFLIIASIVVAIGVVLEFFEDAWEVYESVKARRWPSLEKMVVFAGTILVIFGVIGEFIGEAYVSENDNKLRVNNAAAQGVLDIRARNATQAAVDLATKYGGLQSFVDAQEHQIDGKMGDLRRFAETEKGKTDTAIVALNRDRTDLDNARTEAQTAAAEADKQLEVMRRENAPRTFLVSQVDGFVTRLSRFKGMTAGIFVMHSPTPDAQPLSDALVKLLTQAGWQTGGGRYDLMGGPTLTGIVVAVHEGAGERSQAAASSLVAELNSDGIAALLQNERVKGDPVTVLGAYTGPSQATPDIWLVIGNKPPSAPP